MSAVPVEAAAPNWAEIATEPQCPLCEYMLRGLSNPRCPECGYRFNWPEVLDASKREHPYLFEHHPERNIWSFFKTTFGALRPRRFWAQLHPSQFGSVRRLLAFWMTGTFGLAVLVIVTFILNTVAMVWDQRHFRQNTLLSRWHVSPQPLQPFWEEVIDMLSYLLPHMWRDIASAFAIVALWTWITYLALQIFGISMQRARVRRAHVLRCTLYSIDASPVTLILLTMLVLSVGMTMAKIVTGNRYLPDILDLITLLLVGSALIFNTYRLSIAYRLYLRFNHPIAVAISSQIITALVIATGAVLTALW